MNRITTNPAQCGGRPCIRGMRIRVKDVLDMLSGGAAQPVRFLIDAQLPPALAQWLKARGHEAKAMRQDAGPQVVWLRIGNCVNRVLLAWLEPLFPNIVSELATGQRLVEVEREDWRERY